MNYLTSCPHCGAELRPHAGPPQDAPWICDGCRHGWWRSELLPAARKRYRPQHRDFGHRPADGVETEIREAVARGHSVHDDMLGHDEAKVSLAKYLGVRG